MNDVKVTSSQETETASNDKIRWISMSVFVPGIIKAPSVVGFTCISDNNNNIITMVRICRNRVSYAVIECMTLCAFIPADDNDNDVLSLA